MDKPLPPIRIAGFDAEGEPEIRFESDGSLLVVFNSMPPSHMRTREKYFLDHFDKQMANAVGLPVTWEDREFFRIASPGKDTIRRVTEFIENYWTSHPELLPLAKAERLRDFQKWIDRFAENRVVLVDTAFDDTIANMVIAQLLYLENLDDRSPITVVVDSPGGYVSSGLAIYDTIKDQLRNPVHTHCRGSALGMAAFVMAAGQRGQRSCVPHSVFQLCAPKAGPKPDPKTRDDIDLLHDRLASVLALAVGRDVEQVRADMAMSATLDAQGACRYGLIDKIVDATSMRI